MVLVSWFEHLSYFFEENGSLLTISGGLIGGGLALRRYWADQAWKKKQFAYDYAERVFDDLKAKTALRMLDWTNGEFPRELAEEFGLNSDQDKAWDQSGVITALRPHDADPQDRGLGSFSQKEYVIRELFDVCLSHYERLGHFLQSGIIAQSDFPTTLAYYATLLNEARMADIRQPLLGYMKRYKYDNARALFERLMAAQPAQPR